MFMFKNGMNGCGDGPRSMSAAMPSASTSTPVAQGHDMLQLEAAHLSGCGTEPSGRGEGPPSMSASTRSASASTSSGVTRSSGSSYSAYAIMA